MSPCFEDRFTLMLLDHQDVISEFGSSSRWKELSKEMGSEILPSGDGSCRKTQDSGDSSFSRGIVWVALGWILEEIHVTWAHLEKKRTRLQLYTKSLEEIIIQTVETASPTLATMSELDQDGFRSIMTASEYSRLI
ncbi:hypothetical protein Tco_0999656 [Tanacetum coccineum]